MSNSGDWNSIVRDYLVSNKSSIEGKNRLVSRSTFVGYSPDYVDGISDEERINLKGFIETEAFASLLAKSAHIYVRINEKVGIRLNNRDNDGSGEFLFYDLANFHEFVMASCERAIFQERKVGLGVNDVVIFAMGSFLIYNIVKEIASRRFW